MLVMVPYVLCDRIAHLSYWSSGRPYMYICMYVRMYIYVHTYIHTYTLLYMCMYSYVCMYIHIPTMTLVTKVWYVMHLPTYVCTYVLATTAITLLPSNSTVWCLSFEPAIWYSHLIVVTTHSYVLYTRNPWQARNIICISQSHGINYVWEHENDMYVRIYIVTSSVFAYSFDSGPSTAHRQLWLHDGSLNGSPWYLCVSGSELLRELNHVFTQCTHNNVSRISHMPFVTAHKNMASIS